VTAKVTRIEMSYLGLSDPMEDGRLKGVAEQIGADRRDYYGYKSDCPQSGPLQAGRDETRSTRWRHVRVVENTEAFWNACRPCFDETLWRGFPTLRARRAGSGNG